LGTSRRRGKAIRELIEQGIEIELAAPFRAHARPDEFSRLRIRVHGEKVFKVRWDNAGGFKIVHYGHGDWERTVRVAGAHSDVTVPLSDPGEVFCSKSFTKIRMVR
jgi:hypothetical protein